MAQRTFRSDRSSLWPGRGKDFLLPELREYERWLEGLYREMQHCPVSTWDCVLCTSLVETRTFQILRRLPAKAEAENQSDEKWIIVGTFHWPVFHFQARRWGRRRGRYVESNEYGAEYTPSTKCSTAR